MLHVPEEEISARLADDNPWWNSNENVSLVANYPKRHYFQTFKNLVTKESVNRAIILMGPRRVGKTVMLHQLIFDVIESGHHPSEILYAAIDTPTYSALPLDKLIDIFCKRNGLSKKSDNLLVIFDEVQYLKNWESHLKVLVDKYPNLTFIASGSAAAALRLKSYESGAGRFTDFMLPPLTFAEYLYFIGKEDDLFNSTNIEIEDFYNTNDINELNEEFVNYVNFGGYPEAVFVDGIRENLSRFIKSDIIDKVLLRDLPSLYGIDDIQELNRLFTSVAYNTGNEVSLKELSSSSGVASQTIKRYLVYLDAAFLISRVRRVDEYGKNFKRERGFKVYLTNPSMRAALFRRATADSDSMGQLAETAIFSQWFHSRGDFQLSYARWKKGEVDLVCLDSEKMKPQWVVEVKWSDRFFNKPQDLKSLLFFAKRNSLQLKSGNSVIVTTRTKTGDKKCEGIDLHFVPTSVYCYSVGKNLTLRIKDAPEVGA